MQHPQELAVALADTILARYPDPDTIPYRVWCYVQGYVLCGLEKLWRRTGDDRYLAYVRRFVDQHVTEDGELLGFRGDSLDDMMAGSIIVDLYGLTHEERYRRAAERIYAAFADYPRNADGGFWHGRKLRGQMWIDGVFMGGMFLIRHGELIAEREACFAEVARQIASLADHCRKGTSGLFLHAYDESRSASWADGETGLSPEVWSEGLGWYALLLVEALERWPEQGAGRAKAVDTLGELIEGLLATQDPASGLWYQVVDKGDDPDNWCDTSGSAMFVYALQRAGELGVGPAADCSDAAYRGYLGLQARVTTGADGLVDILGACDGVCVQNSYRAYVDYPRVVNAKEAVGSMLWAATIMDQREAS